MFGIEFAVIALAIEEGKARRKQRELWDKKYLLASTDIRRLMEIERAEQLQRDCNRQLCDAIRNTKFSIF